MTEPAHNKVSSRPAERGYWSIVWNQFRMQRQNNIALALIGALVGCALYAPFISSSQPFVFVGAEGVEFPLFYGLLFNRNLYPSGIDIFFNLASLCLPVFGLAMWWRGRNGHSGGRKRMRDVLSALFFLVVLFVVMMVITPREPIQDYRILVAASEGSGVFPPLRMHYAETLVGQEGPGLKHLLGLDTAGRDVFVRMLFGTRVSLAVGIISVAIYVSIGVVVGAVSGFYGGKIDILAQRLTEIFICFPAFFLILTFISFLERPSIVWVMVFIGVVGWTGTARLVRGEFLRLRNQDFVAAARALGASDRRIIFRHILPNALGPVLVTITFGVASGVLIESSLSFLGIGDTTLPSWGRVLALGRATGDNTMMMIAGLAIFITVSAFNFAGEGLRDALDPRLRR